MAKARFPEFKDTVLWFGTEGCFNPEQWLEQNPSQQSRFEVRKRIQVQLEQSDIKVRQLRYRGEHGYTKASPFIMASVVNSEVTLVPIMASKDDMVQTVYGRWMKLVDGYIHEVKVAEPEKAEQQTPMEQKAEQLGLRHGFDYTHLNNDGIYGVGIKTHNVEDLLAEFQGMQVRPSESRPDAVDFIRE